MIFPTATLSRRALRSSMVRRIPKESRPAGRALSTMLDSKTTAQAHVPMPSITQHTATRSFSNRPSSIRANPQYTVFGEDCLLCMRTILPYFRVVQFQSKTPILTTDSKNQGRMVFEWIPRDASGKVNRDAIIRFALSVEECGLVLDQIPKNQSVVLMRRLQPNPQHDAGQALPDKTLTITPGQGGMVSFKVDFEIDGVGGQSNRAGQSPDAQGPLEVVCQAGEVKVLLSLIQTTLPHLVGWTEQLEVAMQTNVDYAVQGFRGRDGNRSQFSTSDDSYNDDFY